MPTPDGTYLTVQKNNPVRMIGGGKKGTPGYLAGSATHRAVEAGPSGSTLVSPSSLPADTGSAPLGTSTPGNYFAA